MPTLGAGAYPALSPSQIPNLAPDLIPNLLPQQLPQHPVERGAKFLKFVARMNDGTLLDVYTRTAKLFCNK